MSVEFFTKTQLAVQKLNKNARVVSIIKKRKQIQKAPQYKKASKDFLEHLSKELGKNGTTVNHLSYQ
jgi:hypothetical protein